MLPAAASRRKKWPGKRSGPATKKHDIGHMIHIHMTKRDKARERERGKKNPYMNMNLDEKETCKDI